MAGNNVLRELGKLLRSCIREGVDVAARFGGDEFALLLPGVDERTATRIVERLREKVAGRFNRVSISVGIQEYRGESLVEFLERVDATMYREKKAGAR